MFEGFARMAIGLACAAGLACGAPEPAGPGTGPAPPAPAAATTGALGAGAPAALRIARLWLEPRSPRPGQRVVAHAEVEGAPHHELRLVHEWRVDGLRQPQTGGSLQVRGDIGRGSEIEVSVVAVHGERRSDASQASVQVANTPPVLHGLVFEPLRELSAIQDVQAIPNATDADGDELRFEYEWRVNDGPVDASGPVLPAAAIRRGDRVTVTVRATDGEDWSKQIDSDPIPVVNAPPRIESTPGGIDDQGLFAYRLEVVDPDGDRRLAYRLLEGPDGMVMDAFGGTLRWRPTESQAGEHPVRIEVRDPHGGVATQSFEMRVGFEEGPATAPAAPADG